MSFFILYNVVSENYNSLLCGEGVQLFEFSLSQNFNLDSDVTFPCTDIILKLM